MDTPADSSRTVGELQRRVAELSAELGEALRREAAMAEILRVINQPGADLARVLDTMIEKATELCAASYGYIWSYDGKAVRVVAAFAQQPFRDWLHDREVTSPLEQVPLGQAILHNRLVHVVDATEHAAYRAFADFRELIDRGGVRTLLHLPLRKGEQVFGLITVYRQERRPFSDREIALLESFAAQAVIAMENARLLGELRRRTDDLSESLAYQTATSELLEVISRSTADVAPVLDAMLASAGRLCGAEMGGLAVRRDDALHYVATSGLTPEFDSFLRQTRHAINRTTAAGRAAFEKDIVHIIDLDADREYAVPQATALGRLRTLLSVPLLREGEAVGAITLARTRREAFSERQIALVRTFADQAVIALENARLLVEQGEALERQTATAEVLQVINSSPGDLAPVFDAMLEKAMRLCGAAFGQLDTYDGRAFHTAATRGVPARFAEFRSRNPVTYGPGTGPARMLAGERIVYHLDLMDDDVYRRGEPNRRALVELGGARSSLQVALRKDDTLLGFMTLFRQEVRPFTEKQGALLQNFAAQAVIAMENARLLGELRDRQAELRVTFDNMGDGVAMFDDDHRLAAWNRNFQNIIGLAADWLAARPTYAAYLGLLAERGEFGTENVEAELASRLEDTERELRLERTRADGSVIEVRRNAVPGGGFVLIYSDVTERRRAEQAIRQARDVAETALKELKIAQASLVHAEKMASLGQLTAGIAHEIKNPLNFVNNFAGLSRELVDELKEAVDALLAEPDEAKRAELHDTMDLLCANLARIVEHGQRADGIVRSMLLHSRGGSSERQTVDINALLVEALNLAYHGARAQDQGFNVGIERDLQGDMPPVEVVPQDITRVFLNLLANAFYAVARRRQQGDAFRPTVEVSTRDLPEAVEIAIRDNGVGIPSEHRDRLFQPFFTTKPTGEGTGLGLSISYDIVTQQHGGTIDVASEPGRFTEFTIRLPRRSGR